MPPAQNEDPSAVADFSSKGKARLCHAERSTGIILRSNLTRLDTDEEPWSYYGSIEEAEAYAHGFVKQHPELECHIETEIGKWTIFTPQSPPKGDDFIAEIHFLATGGRSGPAFSGYRPQVKFDFEFKQTSGRQTFLGQDIVFPGQKVLASIKMTSPHFFYDRLAPGMHFEICEGPTLVARAVIRRLLNPALAQPKPSEKKN